MVGELLSQAMEQSRSMGSTWQDQEAWVLSIHGTEIRVVTTLFTANYMGVVNSANAIPSDSDLYVFQSRPINLKYNSGRNEIPKVIIALLRYLKMGSPKIARLRAVKANA